MSTATESQGASLVIERLSCGCDAKTLSNITIPKYCNSLAQGKIKNDS